MRSSSNGNENLRFEPREKYWPLDGCRMVIKKIDNVNEVC
jgi:hypothetical protein